MRDVPEILTVTEVAEWLKLRRSTAYKMVRAGIIPCFKIGRQVRVMRDDVLKIIRQQTISKENQPGGENIITSARPGRDAR
ncbi:helix-turn-helix domain-containing protein [Desulfofundulus thermobenzoicus]|uniref:Helix-turn-helix domain-containing protein n=1 Tax=Desulfofundulus thermobenzoicus TaxID=29376 RepID=A0A6N7IN61_9FIRM|nr:helix-turn-helix domain-containing protein [Desulfofundulus thermobenzoicus]